MSGEGRPHYIIDGYNVVLNRKEFNQGKNLEESRDYFSRVLDSYAACKKVELTVVWDGGKTPCAEAKSAGRIRNIYSSEGQNADEKIIRLVQRARNKGRITVVTDDRRHIIGTVRHIGAQTMSVHAFLGMIGYRGRKSKSNFRREGRGSDFVKEKFSADDLSVDEWVRLFTAREKK
jgi:predicted RNA-binding protein with PIN domain